VVSLDGKPILTYAITRVPGVRMYSYFALGEEKELFQAHHCYNWSFRNTDDYFHYYFPDANLEMILPDKKKYRFKVILPKMVEEGVLDREGNLDEESLAAFVAKYHIPLPRSFGSKVHQLPLLNEDAKKSHAWKFSKEYDPVKKEWK
jgi:hypothetical protein